jgi:predicted extracellular nuclease
MFYNVENLFDTSDDSLTNDDDFTPAGALHWTLGRQNEKLNNISKVIIAAGEWQTPALIGLCEIENRRVLEKLVYNTSISKFQYKIIHYDSPDERGIDVALLYDSRKVRVFASSVLSVSHDHDHTRDILYAKTIISDDTCHIFINHWPSRSSGQIETDRYRMHAATVLRNTVDSIIIRNAMSKIIIMGDFNDEPTDDSMVKGLRALPAGKELPGKVLYNLSIGPAKGPVRGTLKYQGNWNIFDQIIVSSALLENDKGLSVSGGFKIFYNSLMLETDESYSGFRPFRTYLGYRYHGGFSDHLPVLIELTAGKNRSY